MFAVKAIIKIFFCCNHFMVLGSRYRPQPMVYERINCSVSLVSTRMIGALGAWK